MYQLPDSLIKEIILAMEADTNLFPAGWKVHLYTNALSPPLKTNVLGDFTEMTNVEVPGYAAVVAAWQGTPIRKPDGSWEDGGTTPLHFGASANPPAPQICYGWYATDGASAVLLGAGSFDIPFTFSKAGDGFNLELLMNVLQQAGNQYLLTMDMEQE